MYSSMLLLVEQVVSIDSPRVFLFLFFIVFGMSFKLYLSSCHLPHLFMFGYPESIILHYYLGPRILIDDCECSSINYEKFNYSMR